MDGNEGGTPMLSAGVASVFDLPFKFWLSLFSF
jgi:hypothetical protein